MNQTSKKRVLAAFDELTRITADGPPLKRKRGHLGKGGTSVTCGHCGHPRSVSGHDCPIARAIDALVSVMPRFEDREKWLAVEAPAP